MRVLAFPADQGACGGYRVTWPGDALKAQGHDVEVRWAPTAAGMRSKSFMSNHVEVVIPELLEIDLDDWGHPDVVVFQRPLKAWFPAAIQAAQAKGVAVVVEVDDNFHIAPSSNHAWWATHPKASEGKSRDTLARCCRMADLVTCTTPNIARQYAGHGRYAVLPNFVPARYLTLARDPEVPVRIGWPGTLQTHGGDLEVTRGAVAQVVRETGVPFHVVGTGKGVKDALRLDEEPSTSGWVELADYPAAVAQLAIGIVPLAPIAFNTGSKSWLKLAEMASLGVASVASLTDDNRRLHALGVGLLADKPQAWRRHLRRLATDVPYREDLAAKGRQVMAGLTIEGNCWRWLEAYALARAHRLSRAA